MGGAPAADLRGRPARVPDVSRAHADHRVQHPALSDRSDPHPPPHPRLHGRVRRRAESAVDPQTVRTVRTVRTGRHATTCVGAPGPLSLTPTPTTTRGGVRRGRWSHQASDPSPPERASHGDRYPDGSRGAPAGRKSRRRPPAGPRAVGDRAVRSADTQPTPIEFPILKIRGSSRKSADFFVASPRPVNLREGKGSG